VAAVVTAAIEKNGPPPALPVGDVAGRRVALDAMLGYFNNQAQPVAGKVDISDHDAIAFDADVSRRAQSDRDRVLRSL
jgi:hypothetical protein